MTIHKFKQSEKNVIAKTKHDCKQSEAAKIFEIYKGKYI